MAKGLIILGGRATGKTTLELNLRIAVGGKWATANDYEVYNGVCFLGKTARKGRVLATAGSERLQECNPPEAESYVASITPGYDRAYVWKWMETFTSVQVINLFSEHRQYYYSKRCTQVSGSGGALIGPAKPITWFHGFPIKAFETEKIHEAYEYAMQYLRKPITERTFTYDIFSGALF